MADGKREQKEQEQRALSTCKQDSYRSGAIFKTVEAPFWMHSMVSIWWFQKYSKVIVP